MNTPRLLYVVDDQTNGHEAASRFMVKMGWSRRDCEIIFAGSHSRLLEMHSQTPSLAVVPIHNTLKGEVKEVTEKLKTLRKQGFNLEEISRIRLKIRHFLMAPQHITHANRLTAVLSHSQALGQCSHFLDSIQISSKNRLTRPSTGFAAREISKGSERSYQGAIAPKSAAKAYGLRILAEDIQNSSANVTTFLLLANDAHVDPKTVGIIGVNGKFGRALKTFFEDIGCKVIGSDKGTELSNKQVVQQADVVIFAVPIRDTPRVVRSVNKYTRPNQLLMDITSVKTPAMKAMLESNAQVVGLHPMFAPEVPFKGQTIVVCKTRRLSKSWQTWLQSVLIHTKSRIKWSTAKTHDKYMESVQASPQSANIVNALLIMAQGIDPKESLEYTSPFYKVMFSLMGRVLSQSPDLYAAIFMENPGVPRMLRKRISIEQQLLRLVLSKDYTRFRTLLKKVCEYFGEESVTRGNNLFRDMLPVMSTFRGEQSVVIECSSRYDQPGLLDKLLRVFRRHQVNLNGIRGSLTQQKTVQFVCGFDRSRNSERVRRALDELERTQNPRVKVLLPK